jgi:hypothetical protein
MPAGATHQGQIQISAAREPYPRAHLYCDQGSCTCPEGPNATCPASGGCDGSSRLCGTSYALTKRLVYQQIMYNSFAVGFEQPGLFNDTFQTGARNQTNRPSQALVGMQLL